MRIKLCGITRREDALLAVEGGVFALGFVFYPPSPRAILPEKAAEIIAELPTGLWKVGVFVNQSAESLQETAKIAGLTHLQCHGNESPEFCTSLNLPVIKAFRLKEKHDLQALANYPQIQAPLFDAAVPGAWGGTGVMVNWDWLNPLPHPQLILAGGLNPENILQAQQKVKPFMLDLSSGVETSPGIKDPQKLRALFSQLRKELD